jgi:hypothetical protein
MLFGPSDGHRSHEGRIVSPSVEIPGSSPGLLARSIQRQISQIAATFSSGIIASNSIPATEPDIRLTAGLGASNGLGVASANVSTR